MKSLLNIKDSTCNDIWLHFLMAYNMGCNDHTQYIAKTFITKCVNNLKYDID